MSVHYTDPYLLSPEHPVTVDLVGMGGTGSQVIRGLARISATLIAMGHPGLHVRCWDDDIVTSANIGRQLFSPADMGIPKATVLATRVNQFYGFEWESCPQQYTGTSTSNILITCVDTAAARIQIAQRLPKARNTRPTDRTIYWMDMGNLQKTGQVILGTVLPVKQPKSEEKTVTTLKHVVQKFPQIKKITEADQGPSCSLAEALRRQDLFINSMVAEAGCAILWKLFREGMIRSHGAYINLETLTINPIKIP